MVRWAGLHAEGRGQERWEDVLNELNEEGGLSLEEAEGVMD